MRSMTKMVGAYRRGDLNLLDSLYRLTISSSDFYDKVIVNRNRIQADGMDSLMKSGKRVFYGSRGCTFTRRTGGNRNDQVQRLYSQTCSYPAER
ncbi:MAG: hypothetical protein KL787_02115 [Taibaiella sp.]|nr:hypothetical protein [Taibaiella sp.]